MQTVKTKMNKEVVKYKTVHDGKKVKVKCIK